MTNVYLVATGQYSNYTIEAIYQDLDDAQRLAGRINRQSRWNEARVETHTLRPSGDDTLHYRELWQVQISINPDGVIADDAKSIHHTTNLWEPIDTDTVVHRIGKNSTYRRVTATAPTEEAALKAARERAAQVATELIEGRTVTG